MILVRGREPRIKEGLSEGRRVAVDSEREDTMASKE